MLKLAIILFEFLFNYIQVKYIGISLFFENILYLTNASQAPDINQTVILHHVMNYRGKTFQCFQGNGRKVFCALIM